MPERAQSSADEMDLVTLFPTLVWKQQLSAPVYRAINSTILPKLDALTAGLPPLSRGEKRQTDHDFHRLPECRALVSRIESASAAALEYLQVDYDRFEITGCWANISAVGDRHRRHTHPNNFLSGVYYAQAQAGADVITFHDPRPQSACLSPRYHEAQWQNAGDMHIEVSEGLLVLFPAWLPHSVPRNRSDRERISVSFNIMFPDYGRSMSAPKWTGNIKTQR